MRITIEVELGNSFSVFQNLHRRQLLGLSLLSRRKKLRREKRQRRRKREESEGTRGREETKKKIQVLGKCVVLGAKLGCPGEREEVTVPRCRSAGRCPPGRGALLRTSSGRSACRCTRCPPSAEEAPCQQRSEHVSRRFQVCEVRTLHMLAKEDSD